MGKDNLMNRGCGMKVVMVTGSYPPDVCGIGDYTFNLMNTQVGREWDLYMPDNWSIKSLFRHIKALNRFKASNIVLQYPTLGYGWSIVPHLLCIYYSLFRRENLTVVLHENSQQTLKHRIVLSLILAFANQVIFTSEFERIYAIKHYSRLKNRSSVVKILSNIESDYPIRNSAERKIDLINFGHIRPGKGIEAFLDVACVIKSKHPELNIMLIGQVPKGFEAYYEGIKSICLENEIQISLNLSNMEVAKQLNNAKIAYLPFPDGVSERRGSFLAALKNGAVVISSNGEFITKAIKENILLIDSQKDVVNEIKHILKDKEQLNIQQKKGFRYLEKEIPKSWDEIINSISRIIMY